MTREQTWEEKYFSRKLRNRIESFSLFEKNHQIGSAQNGSIITVRYTTHPILVVPQTKAILNVHTEDQRGDIIYLTIRPGIRRKGFGRELYCHIEEFFKDIRCDEVILSASGNGKKFWPKMGYHPISPGNSRHIKYLTS